MRLAARVQRPDSAALAARAAGRAGRRQSQPRPALDHRHARRAGAGAERRCAATARAPAMMLYVSGTLGDAAAGLEAAARRAARGARRGATTCGGASSIRRPESHSAQALRGLASACIDVSDGLYVDAQRLLRASGCGATLELERLPVSAALRAALRRFAPGSTGARPAARTTSCASRRPLASAARSRDCRGGCA